MTAHTPETALTITVQYVCYANDQPDIDAEENETIDVSGRIEFDVLPPAAEESLLTISGYRVITPRGKVSRTLPGDIVRHTAATAATPEHFSAGTRTAVYASPLPSVGGLVQYSNVAASERDLLILRALSEWDWEMLQAATGDAE